MRVFTFFAPTRPSFPNFIKFRELLSQRHRQVVGVIFVRNNVMCALSSLAFLLS